MKRNITVTQLLLLTIVLTAFQLWTMEAFGYSSYFSGQCGGCHAASSSVTCNGCHAHGVHPDSGKGTLNVTGVTDKTSYAPGETVTVTVTGGYRTGWVRALLYDQNRTALAWSTGNESGQGGSTLLPATLSAKAPTAPGTYTWKVAWYGHRYDTSGAAFGTGWSIDSYNPNHGYEMANTNAFTVVAAGPTPDTTKPVVSTFTLPATSTSLTVPITGLAATDNVGVSGYFISTTPTAPSPTASGWTATAPTTVAATTPGTITFYVWAKDAAGNVSAPVSRQVAITVPDTTAPTISGFKLPATSSTLTVPVTSFTATDSAGVTGYLVTTSATAPAANAAGWTATPPTSVVASAPGTVTFYGWAKDAAGNVSSAGIATTTITVADTTPPTITAFAMPATSGTLAVPVSSLVASDNIGVRGYLVTESATAPSASAAGWSASPPASVTASAAGSRTFRAWAKDEAGNVSAPATATVTITVATGAPTLTVSALPDGSSTNNETLNLSGTTTSSAGIKSLTVNGREIILSSTGSFSVPLTLTRGANSITVVATDMSGNQKTDTRTITYDPVAPLLTISAPPDNAATTASFVTVSGTVDEASTVTVTGNGGTPQAATMTGTMFTATVNLIPGINNLQIKATDLAGNSSTAKRTVTYDQAKLTLAVTSPSQDITTTRRFITLTGVVKDSTKELTVKVVVAGKTYRPVVREGSFSQRLRFTKPGLYAITVTAADPAGNTATVTRNIVFRPEGTAERATGLDESREGTSERE